MLNLKTTIFVAIILLTSASLSAQTSFWPNNEFMVIKNSDTMSMPWNGGFKAPQFSRVDLNLDGKEDLISYDRADNQVTPMINIGGVNEVKYQYDGTLKYLFPKSRGWMLMRDYNNDGKKDIFYCGFGGDVSVNKNISANSLDFEVYQSSLTGLQYPGGMIPFYVPNSDIPAIYDVNGDGDLDILTFGVLGFAVEYIKNFSVERTGSSDTIIMELKNYCWGHFLEIGTNSNKLKLLDTCQFNVPNPEMEPSMAGNGSRPTGGGSRHAGSTLTAFDNNGDSVADLLIGDVSFNNLVMAQNGGTLPDQNSSITSQDTAFPSYNVPADVMLFPGSFIEDVDNDGLNDLLVAPNTADLSENYNNIWFYKNTGTNKIPNFEFQRKNLFEDDYIDLGERSSPEFFDHNSDGLMDIVVASYGYFNRDSITYDSKLSLYENIGTQSAPMFQFITDNYLSLDTLELGNSLEPTFGDLDGDGDQDMILGNSEGYLHHFTNTAGAGNTASFVLTASRLLNDTGGTIDVGQFSSPQLFDFDKDSDLDLIIGRVNGKLSYYENIGTTSAFNFNRITDSMGRVEIHEDWDVLGAATGFSSPQFYDEGGTTYLYSGGYSGGVFKYGGINTSNPRQAFIIDTVIKNNAYCFLSSPAVYDFKGDGKLDIVVGNMKGGLLFFTESAGTIGLKEVKKLIDFELFPNPANQYVTLKTKTLDRNTTIMVTDMVGKTILVQTMTTQNTQLDVSHYKKGVYFITLNSQEGRKTRKLVVQ